MSRAHLTHRATYKYTQNIYSVVHWSLSCVFIQMTNCTGRACLRYAMTFRVCGITARRRFDRSIYSRNATLLYAATHVLFTLALKSIMNGCLIVDNQRALTLWRRWLLLRGSNETFFLFAE